MTCPWRRDRKRGHSPDTAQSQRARGGAAARSGVLRSNVDSVIMWGLQNPRLCLAGNHHRFSCPLYVVAPPHVVARLRVRRCLQVAPYVRRPLSLPLETSPAAPVWSTVSSLSPRLPARRPALPHRDIQPWATARPCLGDRRRDNYDEVSLQARPSSPRPGRGGTRREACVCAAAG